MSDVRFIVATDEDKGRGDEVINRFLYGGSFLLSRSRRWDDTYKGRGAYVNDFIILVADQRGETVTESNAHSQADRLRSGMIQARVFETFAEAVRG